MVVERLPKWPHNHLVLNPSIKARFRKPYFQIEKHNQNKPFDWREDIFKGFLHKLPMANS